MPALSSDVALAIREVALAQWQSGGIKGQYVGARDNLSQPSTGYFDTLADALQAIAARGALIGADGRKRFTVVIFDLVWLDPSQGTPTVTLIDAEQGVNASFLVSRVVGLDLDAETTTLELFG